MKMEMLNITATRHNSLLDSNDALIEKFKESYRLDRKPIEVNFRRIADQIGGPNRASHLIHSYPAKLIQHIPFFFINNTVYSSPGDTVLDPFCGSGTVLLEALLAGRNAIGADCNPLARLISKVKTTPLSVDLIEQYSERIKTELASAPCEPKPSVVNINYWFSANTSDELARIAFAIRSIPENDYREFYEICLSSILKKVSFADDRVAVPVRRNSKLYGDHTPKENSPIGVFEVDTRKAFFQSVEDNKRRISSLSFEGA
ncbi:MAG: hypothetical protein HN368_04865, partial [Spirochaetales bacterium]|nr:hypothetical protein [Spirochaetales bacterium]